MLLMAPETLKAACSSKVAKLELIITRINPTRTMAVNVKVGDWFLKWRGADLPRIEQQLSNRIALLEHNLVNGNVRKAIYQVRGVFNRVETAMRFLGALKSSHAEIKALKDKLGSGEKADQDASSEFHQSMSDLMSNS